MANTRLVGTADTQQATRKAANTPVNRDVASDAKLSAGTRAELELRGHAVSPFTGALLVGSGDNFREVSEEEYTKVARETAKRDTEKKSVKLL